MNYLAFTTRTMKAMRLELAGGRLKEGGGGGAAVIERGTEVCHTCTGSSHVLAA